ncbi:hypothetical protein ONZ45_g9063 [Pleurotus djamor]|nr:hypothetical protein ONZ45_g9063 [Pleurotus djamor]
MATMESSLAFAELVGLVLETLFFGVYLTVFMGSCYLIFSAGPNGRFTRGGMMNRAMLSAFCVLFASISTHWVIDVVRLFRAFVFKQHGGPTPFYAFLSDGTNVAKTALYALECVIADSIMVLRLHYVWGRSYLVCVFPALTTMSFIVTGTGITYQFVIIKPDVDVFASECGRWILSSFALTLVTNIYSTSLIAYKLWATLKPLQRLNVAGSLPHKRILQIVAESAALYSSVPQFHYQCPPALTSSSGRFPSLDVTSPMIGIVFCLIIVRVHILGHGNVSRSIDASDFQMRSLSVTVNTHIHNHRDGDISIIPTNRKKTTLDDDGDTSSHQI